MKITDELLKNKDEKNAILVCKTAPNVSKDCVLGTKIPILRKIAKSYSKDEETEIFLSTLPHKYLEENIIHAAIISEMQDYDEIISELDKFLPYVDNWMVCDTLIPKAFKKHLDKLIIKIKEWSKSKHTYTIRFGIKMLMSFYLDDAFKKEYLSIPASIHSDEYYINMMIAWYYATALAKQWESIIPYIENNKLDVWVHNKTIQKSRESFRVSAEHKEYLNTLKRK